MRLRWFYVAVAALLWVTGPAMADAPLDPAPSTSSDATGLPAPFQVALPSPGAQPSVIPLSPVPEQTAAPVVPSPPALPAPTILPQTTPPSPAPTPSASPTSTPSDDVNRRAERTHELLTHAVVLAGLFTMDVGLNNSIQAHGFPLISEKTAGPLFLLGDGTTDFLIAEGLHMFGGSETSRAAGADSVRAVLNAGVNVQILKTFFGRANPGAFANDNAQFTGPRLLSGHDSFPSGHTAEAFAFATSMAHYYPKRRKFYFALAGITGLSTMAKHVHWASDVYAGALTGIASGEEVFMHARNLMFIRF